MTIDGVFYVLCCFTNVFLYVFLPVSHVMSDKMIICKYVYVCFNGLCYMYTV